MNLAPHYDAMRTAALSWLAHGEAALDPLIDSPHDTRRGLTLLTRPPAAITAAVQEVLTEFQAVDSAQYYYPAPDIHLTLLSIISCYPGFTLAAVAPARYQAAVQAILADCRPFILTYAGLTASPGGIMVQGFRQDVGLQYLRTTTRKFFQHTDLPQSIDRRYVLQTAHSTVIRFRQPLASPARLLATIRLSSIFLAPSRSIRRSWCLMTGTSGRPIPSCCNATRFKRPLRDFPSPCPPPILLK